MLKDQIQTDFITAMKARDAEKLDTLKMIRSAIRNQEIENRMKEGTDRPLQDEEITMVLRSELKKRQEAIELYKQGGRQDLVDKEMAEALQIKGYLPQLMGREEIGKKVDEVKASLGAGANFGQVMQGVMAQVRGKADGKIVSEVVKERMG